MGAKNLKAIAVHGTNPIPVFDLAKYAPLRSESNRMLKQDNEAKVLREVGTAGAANYSEYMGAMPVKYYTHGSFENVDNISGAKMTETHPCRSKRLPGMCDRLRTCGEAG